MKKNCPKSRLWFRNMNVNLSKPLPARLSSPLARCAAVKIPFPPDIFSLLLLSWRMHSYYEEEGGGFLWAPIPATQKWKPTSQCPKAHVRPPQRRGERIFWGQILTWLPPQIYVFPLLFSPFFANLLITAKWLRNPGRGGIQSGRQELGESRKRRRNWGNWVGFYFGDGKGTCLWDVVKLWLFSSIERPFSNTSVKRALKVGKIPVNVKSGEASMNSNLLLLSVMHGRRRNRVKETKGLHSYFPFKEIGKNNFFFRMLPDISINLLLSPPLANLSAVWSRSLAQKSRREHIIFPWPCQKRGGEGTSKKYASL